MWNNDLTFPPLICHGITETLNYICKLNNSLSTCRLGTSNPERWYFFLVLTFYGDKCSFNIIREQDEGRGKLFSSKSILLRWAAWYFGCSLLWASRWALLMGWGLHKLVTGWYLCGSWPSHLETIAIQKTLELNLCIQMTGCYSCT